MIEASKIQAELNQVHEFADAAEAIVQAIPLQSAIKMPPCRSDPK